MTYTLHGNITLQNTWYLLSYIWYWEDTWYFFCYCSINTKHKFNVFKKAMEVLDISMSSVSYGISALLIFTRATIFHTLFMYYFLLSLLYKKYYTSSSFQN